MFASKDIGPRKVFQKPNILRRKRKPPAKREALKFESLEDKHLFPLKIIENQSVKPVKLMAHVTDCPSVGQEGVSLGTHESDHQPLAAQIPNNLSFTIQNVASSSAIIEPTEKIQSKVSNLEEKHKNSLFKHELYLSKKTLLGQQVDYTEGVQSSLNIDSFLVDTQNKQGAMPNDTHLIGKKTETEVENKWCLNFMSDDSKDMVMPNFYDRDQVKICLDMEENDKKLTSFTNEINSSQQASNVSEQDIIIQSCLKSRVVKYKCDMPNCNKSFWNEARLQKHKLIHSKQKTPNIPYAVECPVKKVDSDGVDQHCGQFFPSRDILVKHLNEDHVPEDAAYKCTRCGRRFWWATGMRIHAQSTCTRALACTWPGCGRVFRQPCRLREHARAHTGDRPYPCNYPNCGWAFRSASKLVRHARRHTGERRHECTACGRAFPRREHLRDHAARHHAPPRPHVCTHPGCEQTFANTNSLYVHLRKVHNVENKKPPAPKKPAAPKITAGSKKAPKKAASPKTPKKSAAKASTPRKTKTAKNKEVEESLIVMMLDGGAVISYNSSDSAYELADAVEPNASAMIVPKEESADDDFTELNGETKIEQEEPVYTYDLEGRCARTHCTWPLQRAHMLVQTTQPPEFTIEEDTQVEQSEGSESNIYTVRSDLFLHGNVLINEDSDFNIRESGNRASEETSNAGQLDGLDLIDAHPTIDLMQEELMYADAAVDESSFRVFMMNGEELT